MDAFLHRLRLRCTEKVRYESAADAAKAAKHIRKKYREVRYAYECPLCGGHHLTSSPPPVCDALTAAVKARLG